MPLKIDKAKAANIKGFLDDDEADRLFSLALSASKIGPCLEIGSYCGKSAIFLGTACKENKSILFSLDHHKGSEEQQHGQEYFDPDLLDKETGRINTLPLFLKTIEDFDLENTVVTVIGRSEIVGRFWQTPLSLIFIDGSHSYESVLNDYKIWSKHLIAGGYLLFHDIFPDPSQGGQAPYQVYQTALTSGLYEIMPLFKSLGILKKIPKLTAENTLNIK